MERDKIIYWVSTGLLAAFILPGIFFINSAAAIEGTTHLGLPNWFRIELSIAQFVAGLVLVIPAIKGNIKEWAYAGLGITYISALIAHLAVDGIAILSFTPIVTFLILATSYIYYNKLNR